MRLAYEILAWLPFDCFQKVVAELGWDARRAIVVRIQLRGGKLNLGEGQPWHPYARFCTFQGEINKWSERPVGRPFLMCRGLFLGKTAYAARLLDELTWKRLSTEVVDFLLSHGDDKFLKSCPPESLVRLSLPAALRLPRAWRRFCRYLNGNKWWQLKDKEVRAYYSAQLAEAQRPPSSTSGVDGSPELERHLSSRSPEGQVKWLLKRVYPQLLARKLAACPELPAVDLSGRIFSGKICLTVALGERARVLLGLLPAGDCRYQQTLRVLAGYPIAEEWLLDPGLKPLLLAVAHPQVQSETFEGPRPSDLRINRGGLFYDVVNYFRVLPPAREIPADLFLELFARGQAWHLLEHPNWRALAQMFSAE